MYFYVIHPSLTVDKIRQKEHFVPASSDGKYNQVHAFKSQINTHPDLVAYVVRSVVRVGRGGKTNCFHEVKSAAEFSSLKSKMHRSMNNEKCFFIIKSTLFVKHKHALYETSESATTVYNCWF